MTIIDSRPVTELQESTYVPPTELPYPSSSVLSKFFPSFFSSLIVLAAIETTGKYGPEFVEVTSTEQSSTTTATTTVVETSTNETAKTELEDKELKSEEELQETAIHADKVKNY